MKKTLTNLLIIILAIIGIADASFITYQEFLHQIPPCTPGFQCEKVLTSPYANIGPVPLSAVGMAYYSIILILAIWVYLEFPLPTSLSFLRRRGVQPLDILQLASIIGLLFSLYLVFVMGVLIQAWCTYCLISALVCASLFAAIWWHGSIRRQGDSYLLKGWILMMGAWAYRSILKPMYFRMDPEIVHNRMVGLGSRLGSNSVMKALLRALLGFVSPNASLTLAGITFSNRIGLSAGFDYNGDLTQTLASVGFGWQTIGTITLEPYAGNPPPRLQRLIDSKALLVNKGLKNIGAKAIIAKLSHQKFPIPIGVSIASTNKAFASTKDQIMDIVQCFLLFEHSAVRHTYYELNVSCPNTFGGEPFTTCPRLEVLLTTLDALSLKKSVFVKLPIDQSEEETLALLRVIDRHKIQGVIFGNLTKDHTNPAVSKQDKQIWNSSKGNVSGRPTFDRSNRLIALTKKRYGNRFIIVGTGGIFSPDDAAKKISLGADLVQLITGMIYEGPQLIGLLNRQITNPYPEKVAESVS